MAGWSLRWGGVGMVVQIGGSGRRGRLGGLPTPLWCCVQGPWVGPCFAPSTSQVTARFWPFLCLIVDSLSQLQMHTVSLVPYSFLCSVAQGEFVQVQTLQQRAHDPTLSQSPCLVNGQARPGSLAGWPQSLHS